MHRSFIMFFYFLGGLLKALWYVRHVSPSARISPRARLERGVHSLGAVTVSGKARIGRGTYILSGVVGAADIGRYC